MHETVIAIASCVLLDLGRMIKQDLKIICFKGITVDCMLETNIFSQEASSV